MKPPVIYHSQQFQQGLIRQGTREQIIEWLAWNDPNGTYTDQDSTAEGGSPLTLEQAKSLMQQQSARDREFP